MSEASVPGPVDAAVPWPPISTRQVTAAVIGNALEFYDFTTYAFFAIEIGDTFFPGHSPFIRLMLSLAAFGAGFVLRPIGSVLIGRYADRAGRRPAMVFSFSLMGLSILALALTPSFAAIGAWAPLLVVTWRLGQGFALGGEVGPTTAYLVEAAPAAKRGLYGAWQGASQNMASIAGGLVGAGLTQFAGPASLQAWGWRAAFLLGALTLPFGLLLRRNLPETLHRTEIAIGGRRSGTSLRAHAPIVVLGLGLIAAATVSTYAFTYITTYARHTLHMGAKIALLASLANGAFGLIASLAGGALSDRYGRRFMMVWPRIAFLLVIWPAFFLMARNRDSLTLIGAVAVLAILFNLSNGAVLVAITESLAKEIRGAATGAIYATSVAVFGGTTQPMITWLIHVTGDPLAPAWYVTAFTVVGRAASLLMKETAYGLAAARPETLTRAMEPR
ncbi:MAG: MFS transporter [Caulobacteraceae bacterium]